MFRKVHVFHVNPQQQLLGAIAYYCSQHNISSGVVVGIIGSVEKARLNFLVSLPGKYKSVAYTPIREFKKEDEAK